VKVVSQEFLNLGLEIELWEDYSKAVKIMQQLKLKHEAEKVSSTFIRLSIEGKKARRLEMDEQLNANKPLIIMLSNLSSEALNKSTLDGISDIVELSGDPSNKIFTSKIKKSCRRGIALVALSKHKEKLFSVFGDQALKLVQESDFSKISELPSFEMSGVLFKYTGKSFTPSS